jgi:hypothetical protein
VVVVDGGVTVVDEALRVVVVVDGVVVSTVDLVATDVSVVVVGLGRDGRRTRSGR